LEDENKWLSEFIAETPQYITLREKVDCENNVKHKVVENVVKNLKSVFPAYKEFSTIDGVRLALKKGWILVRASGTEPLVRLTVEGESLKTAKEIMEKGIIVVKKLVEGMEK